MRIFVSLEPAHSNIEESPFQMAVANLEKRIKESLSSKYERERKAAENLDLANKKVHSRHAIIPLKNQQCYQDVEFYLKLISPEYYIHPIIVMDAVYQDL